MGEVLNIRRSVWRTHLKDETKTHEDEEDPGVVYRSSFFATEIAQCPRSASL
jgi:hypothetical protein